MGVGSNQRADTKQDYLTFGNSFGLHVVHPVLIGSVSFFDEPL